MRRLIMTVLVIAHLYAIPAAALGEEYSSSQLIDRAGEFDGQAVVYSGEVIGDILNSGDHVWTNVSDGSNALGVWVESGLASVVQIVGRYGVHGDSIRVSGTFNRACPEHGGDMDLHADAITLVKRGYPVNQEVLVWKVWVAVLLTIAASVLMVVVLVRISRKRPNFGYRL